MIRRNILENPAWYTAYTPYQPEIAQGRLEALLNFQTDGRRPDRAADRERVACSTRRTAAAEAMALARRVVEGRRTRRSSSTPTCLPQTIAVIRTRAEPLGIAVVVRRRRPPSGLPDGPLSGLLLQYPGASGAVRDCAAVIAAAQERGALVTVAADLLALTLLRAAGRDGRGRRRRLGAAVRRADGLRRAARRLHGGAGRAASVAAGPAGRGVGRRRRRAGVPAGAADPRAAHPPGEGDQQHLHRAGAARGDGRRCTRCTTGRTGCGAIARRVHRLAAIARRRAAGRRDRGRDAAFFDTVHGPRRRSGAERRRRRRERRHQPAAGRRRTRSGSPATR